MSQKLGEKEQSDLRSILENLLFRKALDLALKEVWRKKRGAESLEAAAMAYNHQSGACDLLDELFSLAEMKENFAVPLRKLKHTT